MRIPGDTKDLTIEPLAYIMQAIYGLDAQKLVKAFSLCKKLRYSEREKVMGWMTNYVKQYHSEFTWKDITEAERKAFPRKEDRVMMTIIEEARAEFEQKGLQQGIQKGIQKGRIEGKQEVVVNMLKKQLDISVISEVTGMPKEEIEKLKNGS